MYSESCIIMVEEAIKEIGVQAVNVELGVVTIKGRLTSEQKDQLKLILNNLGLELLERKNDVLIQKLKELISARVYEPEKNKHSKLTEFLSKELEYDYNYLAHIFTESEKKSIEKYYLTCKVKRVKEILLSSENTLAEIAYIVGYSSPAHLSNHFKKITGISPSQFKQQKLAELASSNSFK